MANTPSTITSEIYDLRSQQKLFPIPFLPRYLAGMDGTILDTKTLENVKPIQRSRSCRWGLYELEDINGNSIRRSLERILSDIEIALRYKVKAMFIKQIRNGSAYLYNTV